MDKRTEEIKEEIKERVKTRLEVIKKRRESIEPLGCFADGYESALLWVIENELW